MDTIPWLLQSAWASFTRHPRRLPLSAFFLSKKEKKKHWQAASEFTVLFYFSPQRTDFIFLCHCDEAAAAPGLWQSEAASSVLSRKRAFIKGLGIRRLLGIQISKFILYASLLQDRMEIWHTNTTERERERQSSSDPRSGSPAAAAWSLL